jgi:hypothetical protein
MLVLEFKVRAKEQQYKAIEVGSREWGVGCRSKEIQFINFLLLMIPHDPDL